MWEADEHHMALSLKRWLHLPCFPDGWEVMEVIAAFEGREMLRQNWDRLTEAEREAVTGVDYVVDAMGDTVMYALTMPGNKLPEDHYARQYAVRHGHKFPATPEDPRSVWLRERAEAEE